MAFLGVCRLPNLPTKTVGRRLRVTDKGQLQYPSYPALSFALRVLVGYRHSARYAKRSIVHRLGHRPHRITSNTFQREATPKMASQYAGPIVAWLRDNPGRQTTRDLADGVAVMMTGRKTVQRRVEDPNAVLYDTITKQLWYMTQPQEGDYCATLMRDGRGGWWLEGLPPDPMGLETPPPDLRLRQHQPTAAQPNRKRVNDRRSSAPERNLLPAVLAATGRTCAGCGKADSRPSEHLWHADLIIPHQDGGKAELGNVQALCWPCNNRKRARSMTDLWADNTADGAMWDVSMAQRAFDIVSNLNEDAPLLTH